ncbi:hypothetical protein [Aphanothece hegewaldii]|uniref:hypothetical protein n=1 Tax=Aphanothece hegewaldii TaxID=1521625 RepID=UPI0015E7A4DC|nr:hypothetical protein [Aphanothece hegewaldii]
MKCNQGSQLVSWLCLVIPPLTLSGLQWGHPANIFGEGTILEIYRLATITD